MKFPKACSKCYGKVQTVTSISYVLEFYTTTLRACALYGNVELRYNDYNTTLEEYDKCQSNCECQTEQCKAGYTQQQSCINFENFTQCNIAKFDMSIALQEQRYPISMMVCRAACAGIAEPQFQEYFNCTLQCNRAGQTDQTIKWVDLLQCLSKNTPQKFPPNSKVSQEKEQLDKCIYNQSNACEELRNDGVDYSQRTFLTLRCKERAR